MLLMGDSTSSTKNNQKQKPTKSVNELNNKTSQKHYGSLHKNSDNKEKSELLSEIEDLQNKLKQHEILRIKLMERARIVLIKQKNNSEKQLNEMKRKMEDITQENKQLKVKKINFDLFVYKYYSINTKMFFRKEYMISKMIIKKWNYR